MFDLVRPTRALDSLFSDLFYEPRTPNRWNPRMDISEEDDQYVVDLEVPGVKKEDLNITVEGDLLTLSGQKNIQREVRNDQTGTLHKERFFGTFSRSVRLSEQVNEENIEATINNGILTVRIPKIQPSSPISRRIEIREAN